MIKEIKFIAEDGTEFDNEEDCIKYEEISDNVNLIVMDDNCRQLNDGCLISNYSKYIKIRDEKDLEVFNNIYDYFGAIMPKEVGYWIYNDDNNKYENIEKSIEDLINIKNKLDEIDK